MSAATTARRYRSPSIYKEMEVTLDEFDEEQLVAELAHRRGQTGPSRQELACAVSVELHALKAIRALFLCGQDDAAVRLTRDMIRDTLGTAL